MIMRSLFKEFPILQSIPEEKFPRHIAIIPDGNGRWAQQNDNSILTGHKKGAQQIRKILRDLKDLHEVKIITLWGFSADNWKRSQKEIRGLLLLIQHQLEQTLHEFSDTNARFIHLGRKDRISNALLQTITDIENQTKNNTGQIIAFAIDFGGEDQEVRMLEAARKLPIGIDITTETLWQLRDGNGIIRHADLLIRTAGEHRTSDIGWINGAPTELYFIDKFFPDITTADIIDALIAFSKRERRFGGRT